MIERYTVPGELRESWGGKKMGKVFRDEEGLDAFADEAQYLLTRSLGTMHYDNGFRTVNVLKTDDSIEELLLSEDNSRLYVRDA